MSLHRSPSCMLFGWLDVRLLRMRYAIAEVMILVQTPCRLVIEP